MHYRHAIGYALGAISLGLFLFCMILMYRTGLLITGFMLAILLVVSDAIERRHNAK